MLKFGKYAVQVLAGSTDESYMQQWSETFLIEFAKEIIKCICTEGQSIANIELSVNYNLVFNTGPFELRRRDFFPQEQLYPAAKEQMSGCRIPSHGWVAQTSESSQLSFRSVDAQSHALNELEEIKKKISSFDTSTDLGVIMSILVLFRFLENEVVYNRMKHLVSDNDQYHDQYHEFFIGMRVFWSDIVLKICNDCNVYLSTS